MGSKGTVRNDSQGAQQQAAQTHGRQDEGPRGRAGHSSTKEAPRGFHPEGLAARPSAWGRHLGRVELEGPKAQKQRARGLQGRAAVSRLDEEIRGAPRGGPMRRRTAVHTVTVRKPWPGHAAPEFKISGTGRFWSGTKPHEVKAVHKQQRDLNVTQVVTERGRSRGADGIGGEAICDPTPYVGRE